MRTGADRQDRRRFADLLQIEGPTGRFMLQQMGAVAVLEAGLIGKRDVAALRKGEGMGMAKAAELNGFPGPAHMLVTGDGAAMFRHACGMSLEGIVSKSNESRSVSGRMRVWLKMKNPSFERP